MVDFTPEELAMMDGLTAGTAAVPVTPPPAPRGIRIQDESSKPIPAGRAEVGRLYLTPDKVQRRFFQQEGAEFVFTDGTTQLKLKPEFLIEPIPETEESFVAARTELLARVTLPTDGFKGVLPPDAPPSRMEPGFAYAADDGTLETNKRKRKKKAAPVGESVVATGGGAPMDNGSVRAGDAPDGTYTVPALGVVEKKGMEAHANGKVYPLAPTTEMRVEAAMAELKDAVEWAKSSAADSEDPHAGCIKDAPEKLAAAVLELDQRMSTPATEATNALLASAEALADALLARLKGRRIVITIE